MVTSYQGKLHAPSRERYPHVGEFMSQPRVTVTPDVDIYVAIALLLKHGVTGAPVVDQANELVGIISEKDCLKLVAGDVYDNQLHNGPVSRFMTRGVVTVTPETGLLGLTGLFINHPYKKIPVVEHGKLVGVVRRSDVLAVILDFHKKGLAYMKSVKS